MSAPSELDMQQSNALPRQPDVSSSALARVDATHLVTDITQKLKTFVFLVLLSSHFQIMCQWHTLVISHLVQ